LYNLYFFPIAKDDDKDMRTEVFFEPAHYTVMENVGSFRMKVHRSGNLDISCLVDYQSEDGTANAGSDYEPVKGITKFARVSSYMHMLSFKGLYACLFIISVHS